MTAASMPAWESELKALLEKLRAQPSLDHTEDRQRIAVLQQLIADYQREGETARG